jgi:hypothetical protein
MPISHHTLLKGISSIGETLLMSEIERNCKAFLDWGLLNSAGAWTDVEVPTSGIYGGNFHALRPVNDENYTDGQVWESVKSDWVWETGVNYNDTDNPINISGVYVNGTFYTTGNVTFGHHYNYPLGRVVFDSPIGTGSTVTLEYSYRSVQVDIADNSVLWKELQQNSLRPDDSQWTTRDDRGEWAKATRQQMPAIIVEAVPRRFQQPYELGNGSLLISQDIVFHVISEDRWWRNQLVDLLCFQDFKTIWMFNSDEVTSSGANALDYRGMKLGNPPMYPNLVDERGDGYRWKQMRFTNLNAYEIQTNNPNLHIGDVRATIEVVWGSV